VADHCRSVADEEAGHDLLALRDLDALGIRSAEFVKKVQTANTVALVRLFKTLAEGAHPISVLGYAYALERGALSRTRDLVAAIEAILPAGTMATRCLRVHSAVGTDARHVEESLDFIARLSGADRAHIARAAFETAVTTTVPDGYPGDGVFRDSLAAYRQ
jgi:pyrroloquinoline quinone (PQQ) biosynthesis protein C